MEQIIQKPTKIFKYEGFSIQSLLNLKNQKIYFGPPKNFNDPYDCAITAGVKELNPEDIQKVREHYLIDETIPEKAMAEFKKMTDFSEFANILLRSLVKMIEDFREKAVNEKGISCFSETNDNLLMWSHYADKFRGFCLEFDTSHEPFQLMRKVKYVDSIPQIDPLPLLLNNDFSQMIELLCIKSNNWSYEKEWRSIHQVAGTAYGYDKKTLTGIYFGPHIDETVIEIICTLMFCQNPGVKFYRGEKSETEFKVKFSKFDYLPNIIADQIRNQE